MTETPTPRTVVIAEDETLIRMDLAEMLAEEGYDVVGQAGDGAKAVELAEELKPDLVILDVKMPVLDGIAAAEAIAGQRIAPVVMLTAFSQRDLVERARDAGAMSYLVKPFTKAELVPAIEMAVSRYAEIAQLEVEVTDLKDRLETRKAVDRAKGILQEQLSLTEPEAFRWIQKTAMDLRMSMRQVAEGVIDHGPEVGSGPS
ncbi:response regulator [Nocardioides immobilis]|uniref:Transcriptional regulatory protein PdtaR n=1 Tax=Nocardioides immobilis TaxID=2049295 RepID=A0A417XXT1_9ACTN|nr:response regulator [Nocardioides immobilis]RHW25135.1 response regulator [Nocardioides immobilis]